MRSTLTFMPIVLVVACNDGLSGVEDPPLDSIAQGGQRVSAVAGSPSATSQPRTFGGSTSTGIAGQHRGGFTQSVSGSNGNSTAGKSAISSASGAPSAGVAGRELADLAGRTLIAAGATFRLDDFGGATMGDRLVPTNIGRSTSIGPHVSSSADSMVNVWLASGCSPSVRSDASERQSMVGIIGTGGTFVTTHADSFAVSNLDECGDLFNDQTATAIVVSTSSDASSSTQVINTTPIVPSCNAQVVQVVQLTNGTLEVENPACVSLGTQTGSTTILPQQANIEARYRQDSLIR